jgi:hypothetical protein
MTTTISYPTPSELLRIHIDTIRYAYRAFGGSDVEVREGSDHYRRAKANADRAAIAIANGKLSVADSNPLKAQGQALIDLASIWGIYPRPAAKAGGTVIATFAGSTITIPAGFTGTIGAQRYETISAETYAPSAPVALRALLAGPGGNQSAGATLNWESAAIGALAKTAIVDSAGIIDGAPADDQETLRARLIRRLSTPPVGGNWAMAVETAEGASSAVEAAYAYCAAQGPGSIDVVCTAAGGTRQLGTTGLDLVRGALLAAYPGQEQIVVSTVAPQEIDVVLSAVLPMALAGSGSGGGWLDAVPWPDETAKVTSYVSFTDTAVVAATSAPAVGQSIGIWDPTYLDTSVTPAKKGIMREYVVAWVGGVSGARQIQVVGGFDADPAGCYVSAGALRLSEYARAFADAVAKLGPGQKTSLPELLPRAQRQPTVEAMAGSDLSVRLLEAILGAYPEVADLEWAARYEAGTTTTRLSPSYPATTADPPRILTLGSFAIRKL